MRHRLHRTKSELYTEIAECTFIMSTHEIVEII